MKINRITFVNIYPTQTIARYLISSYVLIGYLKKHLTKSFEVVNCSTNVDEKIITEKIRLTQPDMVVFSCYIWNINKVTEVIKLVKNDRQKTTIVLGGPEITKKTAERLKNTADYYVFGEGEKKLLNLIDYLEDRTTEFPDGVAFYKKSQLIFNKATDTIKNLDDIPSIYLNNIIDDRLYAGQQAFLETQRGCIFRCKYCVYPKFLPTIKYYSLERIFAELEFLIVKKKIKALRIFDAIFTSDLERAKRIVKYLTDLKENDTTLPWIYWEFNYNLVDDSFLELTSRLKTEENIINTNNVKPLDRAQHYTDLLNGYTVINCIGIQSFSNDSLRAVGRPKIDQKRFIDFMEKVKKHNVVLKIDMILGLPFESFDSYFQGLDKLLQHLKDTDHILNIHKLDILPESELEDISEELGISYRKEPPYQVYATKSFSKKDLDYASKLSAILFRIVNSPLRSKFFNIWDTKKSAAELTEKIYNKIITAPELKESKIFSADSVDESYWNRQIYSELKTEWLLDQFEKIKNE